MYIEKRGKRFVISFENEEDIETYDGILRDLTKVMRDGILNKYADEFVKILDNVKLRLKEVNESFELESYVTGDEACMMINYLVNAGCLYAMEKELFDEASVTIESLHKTIKRQNSIMAEQNSAIENFLYVLKSLDVCENDNENIDIGNKRYTS